MNQANQEYIDLYYCFAEVLNIFEDKRKKVCIFARLPTENFTKYNRINTMH